MHDKLNHWAWFSYLLQCEHECFTVGDTKHTGRHGDARYGLESEAKEGFRRRGTVLGNSSFRYGSLRHGGSLWHGSGLRHDLTGIFF